MTIETLLPLLIVAAIAGYVGYLLGRASVLLSVAPRPLEPLPGPAPDAASDTGGMPNPPLRRGAPPAASAGSNTEATPQGPMRAPGAGTPPRRSTKPPPAAAGLVNRDG